MYTVNIVTSQMTTSSKLPYIKQKLDSIVKSKQLSAVIVTQNKNKRKVKSYGVKEGFITYSISLDTRIWCQCMGPALAVSAHVPIPTVASAPASSALTEAAQPHRESANDNNPWLTENGNERVQLSFPSYFCQHILYLFATHFELSDWTICYLDEPPIYQLFLTAINDNHNGEHIDDVLFTEIDMYFASKECGVCLLPLNDPKFAFDMFKCSTCNNFTHAKCMNSWSSFKNKDNQEHRGCIYCRK